MSTTPIDAASDVLARAEGLLVLDSASTPENTRADIRRMALALGVAALDTYLHWAIRRVAFTSMSKKLAGVSVAFGDLVAMGEKSVEARTREVRDRPQTRARNVLNERLLTMTFQTARQVEDALAMLGVVQPWKNLSKAISPPSTEAELKRRLNHLSHRRNKIVHEGDLRRQARPRSIAHEQIEREDVEDDLAWIKSFVSALAQVVPGVKRTESSAPDRP